MKNKITAMIILVILLSGLTGCKDTADNTLTDASLTRVTYDLSHGSVWGVQFYIDITETEIVQARFFRPNESDQTELFGVPVTEEEWNNVKQSVLSLVPDLTEKKEEKGGFFKKQKTDGTENRTLVLTWENENGERTVNYNVSSIEKASALEELLKSLAIETADKTDIQK